MMMTSRLLLAGAMSACLIAVPHAFAADGNWTVAGPADWNTGTSWVEGTPPSGGGSNHARINNGGIAVISADPSGDFQDIFIGDGSGNSGTLNQTGGNVTGAGWAFVGKGGTGEFNLTGGNFGKGVFVGDGGSGTFSVSGTGDMDGETLRVRNGSATLADSRSINTSGEIHVGDGGGHTGTFDADSGTVTAGDWIAVGRNGATGTVNLSGTASMAKVGGGTVVLGTGGGTATVNVSGSANFSSNSNILFSENAGGSATINQSGGSVSAVELLLDGNGEGNGLYDLSGGTLDADKINVGNGTFTMTGGTLSTDLFEGALVQGNGTTSPGNSPGTMTIDGNYSLNSGDLLIELDGVTAGTEYDQLIVTGDVSLAGDLTLDLGFTPSVIDEFIIIDNQGANAVSGAFTQGSSITAGGMLFDINYAGGDGNDVVLSLAIPEPATCLLLSIGSAMAMFTRRNRQS